MYPLPFLTDFYEALSNKIQLSKELLLLSNLKYLCDAFYLFEKDYNFLSKCSFSDVLFVQKLWGERGVTQQKNPLGISNRTNSFS